MNLVLESPRGTVTVPESVLVGIAVRAADSVDGIRVRRRRTVDLESRSVRLSVAATLSRGTSGGEPLLELAEKAQVEVAGALKQMCGIDTTVDVKIGALE